MLNPKSSNLLGRLSRVNSGSSPNLYETRYSEYDHMGRVAESQQQTDTYLFPCFRYGYDLACHLVLERVVTVS